LTHAIQTAKIRYFISEPDLLPNVISAAKATGLPLSNIFVFDIHPTSIPAPSDIRSWTWLQTHGTADWARFNDKETSASTIAARLFSSGTTGLPKALNMSHYNFIAQHTLVMEHRPRPYAVRRLICNPMFHVSQIPRAHTSPLRGGIVTHIMRRFELQSWLSNIPRFGITEVNVVPMMVVMILTSGLAEKKTFASIRNAWSGAAPLDPSLQARFKQLLRDDAPFNQVWGMSETSCIATMLYYPHFDASGSVGPLLPNCDAKLVDEDGKDVTAFGVRGELCVRGPIIVNGYFENEAANRSSWDEDGFFHTGDVAFCKESDMGKLWYIVDRKKVYCYPFDPRNIGQLIVISQELIKVRGFQVAPTELEAVLLHHPEIVDAAVVGVQFSKEESELPRAYVVRRAGSVVTEQEVRKFSSEKLSKYKSLDGGIKFVDAIPKNASGKILKNQLREQAKREIGAKL
jgi:4-coumarate--CoA ligase